jgi:tetratricopeptide (TPR) repeat protein
MIRIGFVLAFLLIAQTLLLAQNPRSDIRKGNEAYRLGEFDKANELYDSHQKDEKYGDVAAFNQANTNFRLEKFEEAVNQYKEIANRTQNKDLKARAFHNLGNSLMKTENYKESVEAYKNALRNNPNDEESRYNLALAKRKLKEQEQQNQENKDDQNKDNEDKKDEDKKDDQDKNENKDENKDQDGDKNEDKKDKKEDEKEQKDGDKKDENKDKQQDPDKQQEPNANPNELSKEDAQRMLDAMQNNEKGTQEKVNQKRVKVSGKTIEKDW